jgi:hypothetical protein
MKATNEAVDLALRLGCPDLGPTRRQEIHDDPITRPDAKMVEQFLAQCDLALRCDLQSGAHDIPGDDHQIGKGETPYLQVFAGRHGLRVLEANAGWTDADAAALRSAARALTPQAEAMMDAWRECGEDYIHGQRRTNHTAGRRARAKSFTIRNEPRRLTAITLSQVSTSISVTFCSGNGA